VTVPYISVLFNDGVQHAARVSSKIIRQVPVKYTFRNFSVVIPDEQHRGSAENTIVLKYEAERQAIIKRVGGTMIANLPAKIALENWGSKVVAHPTSHYYLNVYDCGSQLKDWLDDAPNHSLHLIKEPSLFCSAISICKVGSGPAIPEPELIYLETDSKLNSDRGHDAVIITHTDDVIFEMIELPV